MSDPKSAPVKGLPSPGAQDPLAQEVEQVIAALRALSRRVASPVIKECLEVARIDIAYLASTGDNTLTERFEDDEADAEG